MDIEGEERMYPNIIRENGHRGRGAYVPDYHSGKWT